MLLASKASRYHSPYSCCGEGCRQGRQVSGKKIHEKFKEQHSNELCYAAKQRSFRVGILTQLVPTLQGILERIRWAYQTISCLILHRWASYIYVKIPQVEFFSFYFILFYLFYSAN
jgi:hypothetical protein